MLVQSAIFLYGASKQRISFEAFDCVIRDLGDNPRSAAIRQRLDGHQNAVDGVQGFVVAHNLRYLALGEISALHVRFKLKSVLGAQEIEPFDAALVANIFYPDSSCR